MSTDIALRPRGALSHGDQATADSVLEFESPTAALMAAPVQRSARGLVWITSSLVAAIAAAAGFIPVDKVVTARGKVVPLTPLTVVQPLETSIVRAIDVREGQLVHKGELLARLDPTFTAADMGALQAQVASLQAEVDRLTAEAGDKPYQPAVASADGVLQASLFAQRSAEHRYKLENYRQKIDGLKAALMRAEADVQVYRQRLPVASGIEQMRSELEKDQVGSKLNRLMATDQRMELQRLLADAVTAQQSSTRDLAAMQAEADAYDKQWHGQVTQDLNEATRKLSDAKENLRKAQLRHQLVDLRAEQDSIVQTVAKVSVGSVLQSGDQFITLVPVDAPLEIEARVLGTDSGWVHAGESSTVKFDTFPYMKYGYAEGAVRTLSPDSFTTTGDSSQRGATPTGGGQQTEPYYLSRITLEKVDIHGVPGGFKMMPGMPVAVDIKVGKHTMLDYVFSRVMPVFNEGMREP